jgi:hypothetical protein
MTTIGNTPILYHGTRMSAARQIQRTGFRLSNSRNYTGHGVCLSERITVAYEFGMYETSGCVLEVKLTNNITWTECINHLGEDYDQIFEITGIDALKTFDGNVWILNSCAKTAEIRLLTHHEALRIMIGEFDENGPNYGYNNVIDDYAYIWWDGEDQSNCLSRFPKHREKLAKALQRSVGRIRSSTVMHEPSSVADRHRMCA